eukprot:gnl/MRDRNA2_/MRDRNA2_29613_c0_seq1.p1 gnl/MRDRNA2_/MRDRNA2_29613_c0~~gnl/MRDRNA2_/MRDRNA2_29613_c0_seq1.p1  ORF type:complete len:475 (+),score=86.23 gnl/MRDRNA2_/MRDRNA2_29613_c0_seq1:88-1425(+)
MAAVSLALLLVGPVASLAAGPVVGKTYCGKDGGVSLSIKVDDATHADLSFKILGQPKACNNEAFKYDDSTNTLTLTGLSSSSDCVAALLSKFGVDPSGISISYDSSKDAIEMSFTFSGQNAELTPANCGSLHDLWFEEFMERNHKVYANLEEKAKRFAIFIENLVEIERMTVTDPSGEYSHLSPFADWTLEEFNARNTLQSHMFERTRATQAELLDVSDLPDSFDWRDKGAVNPIKNQEQCGSCWAFSTVANIEGVNFLKTQRLISLSEQELVDCDTKTGDQGCQGGLPSNAFKDMIENKIGLETESDYPYVASNGQCKATQEKEKVFIGNWTTISTDEDQMAAALIKYGPLSIGINAGPMQFYHGGVAKPWKIFCNPKSIDHGVAIVGFGEDKGTKYWTIRNSWGETWGEKGYYRIIRGKNACGLTSMVTTAIMDSSATADLII